MHSTEAESDSQAVWNEPDRAKTLRLGFAPKTELLQRTMRIPGNSQQQLTTIAGRS